MPRNLREPTQEGWLEDTHGRRCREASRRTVPQKTNHCSGLECKFGIRSVRVKRWSKSPPLCAQAQRHGKPHRVQGQIGDLEAARFNLAFGRGGPGYWLLRQMILSLGFQGRQNSAYSPSRPLTALKS